MRLFDLIVTTNWDTLFEQASESSGEPLPLIAEEIAGVLPPRVLVKLHGALVRPDSLVLTESDLAAIDYIRPHLWRAVCEVLRRNCVVVVGSSLRDPSIIRLFQRAVPRERGYVVVPKVDVATVARLRTWNLEPIAADADRFFQALSIAVSG